MFDSLNYPETHQGDVVDDFFGTPVADPFRWLEDADDPTVVAWTQTQRDFTEEILGALPGRETFKQRLTDVWNYPKYGAIKKRGQRIFFTRNDGLQAQDVLYVKEGDTVRELIDPNTLSTDGTVSMIDWQPTADGRRMMYAISESGLDWRTFKVRDVDSGHDFDDALEKIKFSSVAWRKDGSGFYYSRFPDAVNDEGEQNRDVSHQLYYHELGTPQSADTLIFEHPDLTGVTFGAQVSHDDRYLLLYIGGESVMFNRLYYRAIDSDGNFIRLFDDLDAAYMYITNDDDTFYLLTTRDAPNKRLVAFELDNPDDWRDVIAEGEDVIDHVTVVDGKFAVTWLHDAHNRITLHDKDGSLVREIDLPEIGTGGLYGGTIASRTETEASFIPFMSFLRPASIYRYDIQSGQVEPYFTVETPNFDPDLYETRQVFYPSKDGTSVPMFITAKKGLELTGDNPTILYGYGGYRSSQTPRYWSWMPVWLEHGGVFALANLRGGGEYGEKWHRAGMLDQKQNTFDDLHAAAEWLIANQYTSSKKLAIEGRSNGGLLVAAAMLQRPELYGAVLCHVPVADMLRFQHFTAGRYWTPEYGDADKHEDHFAFLYKFSPVHNVEAGAKYPPVLIMTADHDDRVVPMHSKKFAAALQTADTGNNVALLRIETRAGHGMGRPTAQLIEERVDILAFLNSLFEMGIQ